MQKEAATIRGEKPWKVTEDGILEAAIMKYGLNSWNHVASLLPHRSAAQCRERWRLYLSPRVAQATWTPELDSRLRAAVAAFPGQWPAVAAVVGVPAEQCQLRTAQMTGTAEIYAKRQDTAAAAAVAGDRGDEATLLQAATRVAPGGMSSKHRRLIREERTLKQAQARKMEAGHEVAEAAEAAVGTLPAAALAVAAKEAAAGSFMTSAADERAVSQLLDAVGERPTSHELTQLRALPLPLPLPLPQGGPRGRGLWGDRKGTGGGLGVASVVSTWNIQPMKFNLPSATPSLSEDCSIGRRLVSEMALI